ncbi:MAG: hypothetical protein LBG59_05475 [Candidatus Peribacteria bacterium]|nr:hypothetical protein [Candidatus Peribacteria bacterium]
MYKAHYFDTHFTKNDAYHYEMNKQQIDSIAHQLLFTKQGTLFGRSAINLETIRKKMPLLLEKVKDTLTQGKSENKDLAPEDLPFIVLLLPRAEEIKYPLLEKMLEIIASLPITTIAHRQKIATHNESIRQKLLQQFGQEDKEKLLKY